MLKDLRIGFIGWGKMAEAMIRGLLKGFVDSSQIIATGRSEERGAELHKIHGIQTSTNNLEAVNADVIVLSVKPHDMPIVLSEVGASIAPASTVISIAAGIRLEKLAAAMSTLNIIRAMPNTPGRINKGITVWTHFATIDAERKIQVGALLGALGEEVHVDKEIYIDMTTAVSGSGPGIFDYILEAYIDSSVRLEMPRHLAKRLALATMIGTAEYARQVDVHLAQLCDDVTSAGGTTGEAIYQLDKAGFRATLADALMAAYQRSLKLGE